MSYVLNDGMPHMGILYNDRFWPLSPWQAIRFALMLIWGYGMMQWLMLRVFLDALAYGLSGPYGILHRIFIAGCYTLCIIGYQQAPIEGAITLLWVLILLALWGVGQTFGEDYQ